MPTFAGTQKVKGGTLSYGERDPVTGTRYEEFTPDPVVAPVTTPKPTTGDIYKGLVPDVDKTQEGAYSDYENILKTQMAPVDEADIQAKTMARFQAEIDALNRVYAEKKQEEMIAGKGRLGSDAAIQSRRGLIGSDFGTAQTEKVSKYNQSIQDSIDAEKASKISSILSQARKDASEEVAAKTAARKAGAQEYLTYLSEAAGRKTQRVADTVKNVLLNGVEGDDNLFKELATMLGVSPEVVKSQYNQQKAAQAGETEKPVVVAPGSSIFDPVTGKFIGTAPEKPADNKPITAEVGNTLLQWDAKTNSWKSIYTAPDKDSNAQNGSEWLSVTEAKALGVPYGTTRDQAAAKGLIPGSSLNAGTNPKFAEDATKEIDALLADKALLDQVGFRLPGSEYLPGYTDLTVKVNRIKSLLTTDNLKYMKGLGAMSDREFQNLASIATTLDVNMSEEAFKKELDRIKTDLKSTIDFQASQVEEGSGDEVDSFLDSFNSPLSMGVNGSTVSGIRDGSTVHNLIGDGVATGIQNGSGKWKYGFDFVLKGGKGAPVPAPFSGTVVAAKSNGGFGNQVKIRFGDGSELWISHLDSLDVKPGQKITKGMIIGKQGNTGALLSSAGLELTPAQRASGRGTHLDLTIKKPDGKYLSSQEVAALLKTSKLT